MGNLMRPLPLLADVLVVEAHQLREAHHAGVEVHPLVHLAPAHVAHHVVDELQAHRLGVVVALPGAVAGQEGAFIVVALHEDVHRLAVGVDAAAHHVTVLILLAHGLHEALRAALGGLLPGLLRIGHPQGDHLHAITVLADVLVDRALRVHWRGEHQADLVLLQHVAGAVLHARLQAGIGHALEAPRALVVVGALLGVAHVQFHVVRAQQGQEVLCIGHDLLQAVVHVFQSSSHWGRE